MNGSLLVVYLGLVGACQLTPRKHNPAAITRRGATNRCKPLVTSSSQIASLAEHEMNTAATEPITTVAVTDRPSPEALPSLHYERLAGTTPEAEGFTPDSREATATVELRERDGSIE